MRTLPHRQPPMNRFMGFSVELDSLGANNEAGKRLQPLAKTGSKSCTNTDQTSCIPFFSGVPLGKCKSWGCGGASSGRAPRVRAPFFVRDSTDFHRFAPQGQKAYKYKMHNSEGSPAGNVSPELDGNWPTRLLDINIDKQHERKRHAEHVVAGLLHDIGELGIWNIVPRARSYWDRLGVSPIDAHDGRITRGDYADARAERERKQARRGAAAAPSDDAEADRRIPRAVAGDQVRPHDAGAGLAAVHTTGAPEPLSREGGEQNPLDGVRYSELAPELLMRRMRWIWVGQTRSGMPAEWSTDSFSEPALGERHFVVLGGSTIRRRSLPVTA